MRPIRVFWFLTAVTVGLAGFWVQTPAMAQDAAAAGREGTAQAREGEDVSLRGPVSGAQGTAGDAHSADSPATQGSPSAKRKKVKPEKKVRIRAKKTRKDMWIAYRMAKDEWIDKAAQADPAIVAAICAHSGPARLLAKHRHIAEIAEADHYLCRRLTRWRSATWALLRNPDADRVIAFDPEGIYRAISRDPKVARVLAKHVMFNQMVVDNPDLGIFIAKHM